MSRVLAATYHRTSVASRPGIFACCACRPYDCVVRVDSLRTIMDDRTQYVMYRGKADMLTVKAICGTDYELIRLRRDDCSRAELTGSRMLAYIADRLDQRDVNVNRHTVNESTALSCFGIRDRTDRAIVGVMIGTSDYVRMNSLTGCRSLPAARVMSVDASMSIAIMTYGSQSRTIEYAGSASNWPVVDQSLRRVFRTQKWTVLLVLDEKIVATIPTYIVLYGMTDDPNLLAYTKHLPRPLTDVAGTAIGHCLTQHMAKGARQFDILSRDLPTMQCTVYDVLQSDPALRWKVLCMTACATSAEEHIKSWLSAVAN